MSEQTPESTEGTEGTESTGGDTNVEANQVNINQAPDGGGIDNNEATEATEGDDSK